MQHKMAETRVPIHTLIARRWSPRSFDSERALSSEELVALLEAARWAPSCFGDQPWRYVVCDRDQNEVAWKRALDCLAEGNQRWARNAPVLLLAAADGQFTRNDAPNRWGPYDAGAASENLCLQATALGLAAHQMGGFDAERARRAFAVPERYTCMAMIAVGHPAPADMLDAELRAAEEAPRTRRPLGESFFRGTWATPLAPEPEGRTGGEG